MTFVNRSFMLYVYRSFFLIGSPWTAGLVLFGNSILQQWRHKGQYTQYPLQEIQLQEPVLEFGKKLETTSTEILRLRDIQITGKLVDPSKNDYSVSLPWYLAKPWLGISWLNLSLLMDIFCGNFLTSTKSSYKA